ncbi:MAG: hypothetical protein KKB30_04690 [Proteobacteria bacterium]|nr:hypothetical protein [Pseudomonadota bacterium]MBU1715494.1 hypothetical protein [Pseudomonadota bacterium]
MTKKDSSLGSDDWLDDFNESADSEAPDELDQSSIDSLFGSVGTSSPAEPVVATAGDEVVNLDAAELGELDQSTIDALLSDVDDQIGGSAGIAGAADESLDGGELDQATIDALLGNTGQDSSAAPVATADVSGATEGIAGQSIAAAEVADDDSLYTEVEKPAAEAGSFEAETVDFSEVFGNEETGDASFGFGSDIDDFSLDDDDLPDIPDENEPVPIEQPLSTAGTFAQKSADDVVPGMIADTLREEASTKTEKSSRFRYKLPAVNRRMVGVSALCLLLLTFSSIGGMYYFKNRSVKNRPAIILPQQTKVAMVGKGQPPATTIKNVVNRAPVAQDGKYMMTKPGESITIALFGKDADGDALKFEVSNKPAHGRISGEPPELTYLPDNDFPGEDRFEFKVSDSKEVSAPATILIAGPALSIKMAATENTLNTRKTMVGADNLALHTLSTEDLIIDWPAIWEKANDSKFGKNVEVEILAGKLNGEMQKISRTQHRYKSDPYWSGREVVRYRFRQGNLTSKARQIDITVEHGEPLPEIVLAALKAAYEVGEKVIIDASKSVDNDREGLIFAWEQLAGVPLYIEKLNEEGSVISFVMPSYFYTVAYPEPVLQVKAVDSAGQYASKQVQVPVASRLQEVRWSGLHPRYD